jgi:hypothetical protein
MTALSQWLRRDPNWEEPVEADESPWHSRRVHLGSEFWSDGEDDGGAFVTLLPIYDPPDYRPYDVVCWRPERPQRWWRSTGLCDVLGEGDIRAVLLDARPKIWLTESPAEWLTAITKVRACTILDWRIDLRRVLRDVVVIRCTSVRLERKLDEMLDRQVKHRFSLRSGPLPLTAKPSAAQHRPESRRAPPP